MQHKFFLGKAADFLFPYDVDGGVNHVFELLEIAGLADVKVGALLVEEIYYLLFIRSGDDDDGQVL